MKAGWQTKPFEECIEKVTYTAKIQRKDFLDDGVYQRKLAALDELKKSLLHQAFRGQL